MVEVSSNVRTYCIVFAIIIMLYRLLVESDCYFCQPEEFENVENPYFGNLNHYQNPGNLPLNTASM